MKSEIENVSEVKKVIRVEVPWEDVDKHIRQAVREISRRARIPGFRPGKAPESLIRTRFAQHLKEEVMNHLVPEAYKEAVKEHKLEVIAEPSISDVIYTEGSPFEFKLTVETRPNVEAKEYMGIELKGEEIVVKDEEVEAVLKQYQENAAELIPLPDTGAEPGHYVNTHLKATTKKNGSQTLFDDRSLISLGPEENHPSFNENLAGKKAGETAEFDVVYAEDYAEKSIAGKTIHYKVDIESVNRKQISPLDDEFAKDLGEFSSLDDLKEKIRKDISNAKDQEQRNRMKDELLKQIIDQNPFEVPESMVNQETESLVQSYARSLYRRGANLKDPNIDWKDIQAKLNRQADQNIRGSFLIHEIAKKENVQVTDEDVEAAIAQMADQQRRAPEAIKAELLKDQKMDQLKDRLLISKTLDFLLGEAKITYT